MPVIDLVHFEVNSNQYITKKLPAIQANLSVYNVFESKGRPFGILSKLVKRDQIVLIDLNKVEATKHEINDILQIISKLQQDEKTTFTNCINGYNNKYILDVEIQNLRTEAKYDVENILG